MPPASKLSTGIDPVGMPLSDLLRISLQTVGVQEVSLKEELDFLSKYLEIEQTRFRDRLTVVFDVPPDTFDALVPNLILQPLVENAIKHGVAKKAGPGHIDITTRRDGDKLLMDVQDSGRPAMPGASTRKSNSWISGHIPSW